jgi:hypothetical protein
VGEGDGQRACQSRYRGQAVLHPEHACQACRSVTRARQEALRHALRAWLLRVPPRNACRRPRRPTCGRPELRGRHASQHVVHLRQRLVQRAPLAAAGAGRRDCSCRVRRKHGAGSHQLAVQLRVPLHHCSTPGTTPSKLGEWIWLTAASEHGRGDMQGVCAGGSGGLPCVAASSPGPHTGMRHSGRAPAARCGATSARARTCSEHHQPGSCRPAAGPQLQPEGVRLVAQHARYAAHEQVVGRLRLRGVAAGKLAGSCRLQGRSTPAQVPAATGAEAQPWQARIRSCPAGTRAPPQPAACWGWSGSRPDAAGSSSGRPTSMLTSRCWALHQRRLPRATP